MSGEIEKRTRSPWWLWFLLGATMGLMAYWGVDWVGRVLPFRVYGPRVLEISQPTQPSNRVLLLAVRGRISPFVVDLSQSSKRIYAGCDSSAGFAVMAWSKDWSVVAFLRNSSDNDTKFLRGYDFTEHVFVQSNHVGGLLHDRGGEGGEIPVDFGLTDCGRLPTKEEWRLLEGAREGR